MFKKKKTFIVALPLGWGDTRTYVPVYKLTPNNVLTFILSLDKLLYHSNSIVMVLHKTVPLTVQRFDKGKYRVGVGVKTKAIWSGNYYFSLKKEDSQQYFKGIKFRLPDRLCLNPQPDETIEEVPEERRKWRRDLRRYKRGLKSRAKVGALTGHIDRYEKERNENAKLDWQVRRQLRMLWTNEWIKRLVRCMKKEEYPSEILYAFVRSADRWHRSTNPQHIIKAVDEVFTAHSEALRREYGVFGRTLHKKK